jgi:hypothetical protein
MRTYGIDPGLPKEAECGGDMQQELVLKSQRKVWVHRAQSGNEVILECVDGIFCRVAPVHVWGCHLDVDVLLAEEDP